MHEHFLLLAPPPPPRPTAHIWLGVVLSGLMIGLGAFHAVDLRQPAQGQIVLDLDPRGERAAATNEQIRQLAGDIRGLMAELKRTQHALAQAQIRIAQLERENKTLRGALVAFDPDPPPVPSEPAAETREGLGGPFVKAPPEPEQPSPQARSGPQACWMREATMISTYRIAIRDDGFALAPAWDGGETAWPEEFAAAMAAFRGEPLTAPAAMSRAAFMKAMRPYYDFGMKQAVLCRFLVTVTNETSNPESWTAGMELVERYFFKIVRGRRSDAVAYNGAP